MITVDHLDPCLQRLPAGDVTGDYPLHTFLDGLNKRQTYHDTHLHNGKTSANEHDNHSKHQHQEGYDLVSGVPSPLLGQLQVASRRNNEC